MKFVSFSNLFASSAPAVCSLLACLFSSSSTSFVNGSPAMLEQTQLELLKQVLAPRRELVEASIPQEKPASPSSVSDFDDEIWQAAFDDAEGIYDEEKPQFKYPEEYLMYFALDVYDTEGGGTSILNTGTIDQYYIIEVNTTGGSGEGGRSVIIPVTWENDDDLSAFFFPLYGCESGSNYSYMMAYYYNLATENTEFMCYMPPEGTIIDTVGPATISKVIQLIHGVNSNVTWDYAGTSTIWIGSLQVEVDLFVKPDFMNPVVVATNSTSGKLLYVQVRYNGLFVRMRIWDYRDPEFIAVIDNLLGGDDYSAYCYDIKPEASFEKFLNCSGEVTPDSVRVAIGKDLKKKVTGRKGGGTNRRNRMLQENPPSYPSALKPYKNQGTVEEREMLQTRPWFLPPDKDRPFLPIRSQGNCGSCWALAATHSISSVYAQAHNGELYLFSYQHVMNCMALEVMPTEAGCFGGLETDVFDWLKFNGGRLPLLSDVPYIEFQAGCLGDKVGLKTEIKGYSQLTRDARIRNALYFRGDVIVSLSATPLFDWTPSEDVVWPISADSEGGEPEPYLSHGISASVTDPDIDHTVVLIGWGTCNVTHCLTNQTEENATCWIVQNSWGETNGYHGLYFVHAEKRCDLGISRYAYIPMIE